MFNRIFARLSDWAMNLPEAVWVPRPIAAAIGRWRERVLDREARELKPLFDAYRAELEKRTQAELPPREEMLAGIRERLAAIESGYGEMDPDEAPRRRPAHLIDWQDIVEGVVLPSNVDAGEACGYAALRAMGVEILQPVWTDTCFNWVRLPEGWSVGGLEGSEDCCLIDAFGRSRGVIEFGECGGYRRAVLRLTEADAVAA